MNKPYYEDDQVKLLHGDVNEQLKFIKSRSIDMIFADPPYFLSNGGITCHSGQMVAVNKADWDQSDMTVDEKIKFNARWIRACKRVLKDDGSIWISGTMHNIFIIGVCLEKLGFQIINNITWQKTNPPPHLAKKAFTHSTETVIWARKKGQKNLFNYDLMKSMNNNKQMKDVWTFGLTKPSEKRFGKHPTQKPLVLLERIILASTQKRDLILDPFSGSGTTGVAAKRLGRKYIGIDFEATYLDISIQRILNEGI